jgi:hypothetical protein
MNNFWGPWEALAFILLIYWTVSGLIRNHRWLRAIRIEHGRDEINIIPLLRIFFFRSAVRREDKKWAEEVIERHNKSRKTDANS